MVKPQALRGGRCHGQARSFYLRELLPSAVFAEGGGNFLYGSAHFQLVQDFQDLT